MDRLPNEIILNPAFPPPVSHRRVARGPISISAISPSANEPGASNSAARDWQEAAQMWQSSAEHYKDVYRRAGALR